MPRKGRHDGDTKRGGLNAEKEERVREKERASADPEQLPAFKAYLKEMKPENPKGVFHLGRNLK